MKTLKILVVVMGVLIVAGIAALVTLVVDRAAKRPPAAAVDAPASTTLTLPGNARVVETTSTNDRVALRIAVPGEPDRIYFLDHHTGIVRSIVTLDAASEKIP